jgi:hypothetical protein
MSAKTDVEAIRLIDEEVVRLLSLPEGKLDPEVRDGLRLIADLAKWRDIAYGATERSVSAIDQLRMDFEVFDCGVDETKPLLYLWQIEDENGVVLYRYVGKSERGASRPLTQYRRNVANHLAGRPYRKGKPDAFRAVHLRMSDAVAKGHRITLYLLQNVGDVAQIFSAERTEQKKFCSTPYCDLPPARLLAPRRLAYLCSSRHGAGWGVTYESLSIPKRALARGHLGKWRGNPDKPSKLL